MPIPRCESLRGGLQVAGFALTVDMRKQVLVLRQQVEESSQALMSLHDVITTGFEGVMEQGSSHQAK